MRHKMLLKNRMTRWLKTTLIVALGVVALGWSIFAGAAHAVPIDGPRLKPPAPALQYISEHDHDQLTTTLNHLKRGRFSEARATVERIDSPVAKSLAQWFYFYNKPSNVSITDGDMFLDLHSDWPALHSIQRHLESKLSSRTKHKTIIDFFETRDPVTGHGKIQLARALLGNGDREAGITQLRDAWVNFDLSSADERYILANYPSYLRAEDHTARVDRLLWERKVTASRRIISRLPSAERSKAHARALLLLAAKEGPDRYRALSADQQADSGVMLAAVRYYRRARQETKAIAIARQAVPIPEILRNPARWWDERQLLMRWAIKERRYEDAYAMASGHGLEPSTDFSEAEFNAGWLALRYLGAPERAETHFRALLGTVSAPISLARGHYWVGRALEEQGKAQDAATHFHQAANYPYTYYGQMAAEHIGGEALSRFFDVTPTPTPAESARFTARPLVAALQMLSELNHKHAFLIFAYHLDDRLETGGEYLALAELANNEGAVHITVRAGKVAVRNNAFVPDVSYPLIFVPDEAARFAPKEIILGLSRQESEFNTRAYSRAGARGLMQLMPATAQLTARKENLRYSRSALLDDPIYNMTIGSAHLSHLFERFNGSYAMTLAAYNAGPHRVSQWIEAYGDPRSPQVDPIDWVESIPFAETRNYVQRVLENTQIYRARLNSHTIPGRLALDLERGGPSGRVGSIASNSFEQLVSPLPQRTQQFALASLELTDPANAAVPTAPATEPPLAETAPAPNRRSEERRRRRPKTRSVDPRLAPVKEPPTHTPAAPAQEKSIAAKSEPTSAGSVTTSSATDEALKTPIAMIGNVERIPDAESTAANRIKNITASTAPADSTVPNAEQAQSPVGERIPLGRALVVKSPDQEAAAQPIASADVTTTPATTKQTSDAASFEPCETYRHYIARVQKEEASAADLNAGMLAELKSGAATGC